MKTSTELDPMIENIITERIAKKLDICAKRRMPTLIFGETGRGKTLAARHWCAANERAVYLQLKAGSTLTAFVRQLAKALTGRAWGSTRENMESVESYLAENDVVLVIDEANQLMAPATLAAKQKNFEYIRLNIFEQTGTPVALIFTTYSLEEFTHGALAGFLEQFLGRSPNRLDIPPGLFSVSEVTPIVRQYAEPTPELIAAAMDVAAGNGKLRSLTTYLKIAKGLCDGEPSKYRLTGPLLREIASLYEDGGAWPKE